MIQFLNSKFFMRILTALLMAAGLTAAGQLFATDTASSGASPLRKTAIIVENLAGTQFNDKIPVLEDLVGTRVAGRGYSVISRDVVTQALSGQPNTLDSALNDDSSALRLAQNLGADFILVPSIATYGIDKKTYNGNGIVTLNITHTLRVSYKIVEAGAGGAIRGGTVTATKTIRQTSDLSTDDSDVINELLDDAADQLADAIVQNATSLPTEVANSTMVDITVSCGMQDLAQLPVSVPDIRVLNDGTLLVQPNRLAVQVLDATVEVNGVAVGTAPGKFKAPPGLNKMRITREGFNPWERTVNFSEGQKFNIALQMSDAGYARWKDNTVFLYHLENGKKLTQGTVDMMDGFAQTLRQSGYRVDSKTDVKADIQEKGKSLFDGASLKAF
jgi:hypothetical protein